MRHIAFSGISDQLFPSDFKFIDSILKQYLTPNHYWHVGDAKGVDEHVEQYQEFARRRENAELAGIKVYKAKPTGKNGKFEPYDFAKRTKKMVRSLPPGAKLIAFPWGECPKGCYPGSGTGNGSGTWLCISEAVHREIIVEVYPLSPNKIKLPSWVSIQYKQLDLFGE